MEAFLVSTGVVALAEMGDKTQLLAIVLAARFSRPYPIIFGIFVATILNHAGAGAVGEWLTFMLGPDLLRQILGVSFILMALWMLVPDKLTDEDTKTPTTSHFGIFGITFVAFFLAEMGDKTQIATIGLAARYGEFYSVVLGTTFGMMLANVPAVFLGEHLTKKIPIKTVHSITAIIFLILGFLALFDIGFSQLLGRI